MAKVRWSIPGNPEKWETPVTIYLRPTQLGWMRRGDIEDRHPDCEIWEHPNGEITVHPKSKGALILAKIGSWN